MRHPVRRLLVIAAITVAGFAATNTVTPAHVAGVLGPGPLLVQTTQVAAVLGPGPLSVTHGPIS